MSCTGTISLHSCAREHIKGEKFVSIWKTGAVHKSTTIASRFFFIFFFGAVMASVYSNSRAADVSSTFRSRAVRASVLGCNCCRFLPQKLTLIQASDNQNKLKAEIMRQLLSRKLHRVLIGLTSKV